MSTSRQLKKKADKLAAAGKITEAINAYEEALRSSPDNPDILFAIGNLALKSGMYPIAEQMFRMTCQYRPDSLEAATQLAIALKEQDRIPEAIEIYQRILEAKPDHIDTWINIGVAAQAIGDFSSADIAYRRALELNPRSVAALTNVAELLSIQGSFEDALSRLDQAVEITPDNPFIRYNRGEILLTLGRLSEGWPDLNFGERHRPDRQQIFQHGLPRWQGEPLTGKSILISCEQGIGDQVRFLNAISTVLEQADRAVIECDPRLVDTLARTYPKAEVRAFLCKKQNNRHIFSYDWPVDSLNFSSTLLNLFEQLCPDLEKLPTQVPLVVDPELDRQWRQRVAGGSGELKVGLCWRGGARSLRKKQQYAAIEAWGPILKMNNVRFFSLMYDDCDKEIRQAKSRFGAEIIVYKELDYRDDINSLLALTAQMDAVVSAHSAAASFAGGLGIPTYMPLTNRLWDMLGTDVMAMTPSMRPVIQTQRGNWKEVMEKIAGLLSKHRQQN